MTEAEKLLLGTAKLGSKLAEVMFDKVGERAFSTPEGREIYVALRNSYMRKDEGIEAVILDLGASAIQAFAQILTISDPAGIDQHCRRVNEGYVSRERSRVVKEQAGRKEVDAASLKKALDDLDEYVSRDLSTIASLADKMWERSSKMKETSMGSGVAGLRSGIKAMDDRFSGFQPGMHVITAQPGTGKTSLALCMMSGFQEEGGITGFLSLEMTKLDLLYRVAAAETDMDSNVLKTLDLTEENVGKFRGWIDSKKGNLSVVESPRNKWLDQISDVITRMVLYGCKVVFVDYIQLIKSKASNEAEAASIMISSLAKDYEIPIIALAQLNREIEKTKTKKPQMSYLKGASQIEQDATSIQGLWWPHKHGLHMPIGGPYPENYVCSMIMKNRNAPDMRPIHMETNNFRWSECQDPEEG